MNRLRAPSMVLALVAAASALVITPGSAVALAQPDTSALASRPGQISVSGSGMVTRKPDYLQVIVGTEINAKTASDAQKQAGEIMTKTLAALKALNLPGEEIQTASIQLNPRYTQVERESPRLDGYVATATLRVRTTDVKAGAAILDAAIGAGASRIDSIDFGILEAIDAREEALKLAVQAARRKAMIISASAGVELGRLLSANESSPRNWGMAQYANRMDAGLGEEGAGPVVPGMVEVRVDVSLTYEIKP